METIVRNVRDLPEADRTVFERFVGHHLRESQQIVIHIVGAALEPVEAAEPMTGQLPEWCNVYEGLSDEQIDELDRSIVRDHSSRDVE